MKECSCGKDYCKICEPKIDKQKASPFSVGLANFSFLALGTRFKYKEGETVWVKIGADLIARWDAKEIATKWVGQPICCATENGEEIEVRIVG